MTGRTESEALGMWALMGYEGFPSIFFPLFHFLLIVPVQALVGLGLIPKNGSEFF